jgi:ABC-type amino acid transport substrate-binding protein
MPQMRKVSEWEFRPTAPLFFFNDDKDFTIYGVSVDIAKLIADNMGVTLQFHTLDILGYAEALENGVVRFYHLHQG